MEQEIKTKIDNLAESVEKATKEVREVSESVEIDRKDLQKMKEEMARVNQKLENISEDIEKLNVQVKDLKRLISSVPDMVKTAVDNNLSIMSPSKFVVAYKSPIELIKLLFKLNK